MKASASMAAPWRWHSWQISMLAGLCLLVTWPAAGQEEERSWEVYTTTGVELKEYTAPVTVEVGEPVPVEVPSVVTGTGQGTRLTGVTVEVHEGVGGHPASGPVDERVMALAEDLAGNLWVATQGGLSRFDGRQWTTFTEEDGLAGNLVGDLVVDPRGHLWISCGEGTVEFDGQRWIQHQLIDTEGKPVRSGGWMSVAPDGDVWLTIGGRRTTSGLLEPLAYRFDGQDWWEYCAKDGLPLRSGSRSMEIDHQGTVWISYMIDDQFPGRAVNILTSFDGQEWRSYDIPPVDSYIDITRLFVDSRNRLWVGTGLALLVYDGQTWRQYEGRRWSSVEAIAEDARGRIWVGGIDEIGCLAGPAWTAISKEASQLMAQTMLFDRRGDLWLGSWVLRQLVRWPGRLLPTSVEGSPAPGQPRSFQLFQNYPNPFNQGTQVAFQLPVREAISLNVFGLSGQSVATLAVGDHAAGAYQVTWDGQDEQGQPVASGLYLCTLTAGEQRSTRKMSLVR